MLKIIVDILQIISPQVYLILPIHFMMEMLHLLIFLHLRLLYSSVARLLPCKNIRHTLLKQGVTTRWLWVMDYDNSDIKDGFSDLLGLRSSSNEVVDNSGLHGSVTRTGTVSLDAHEYHPILIYFGENAGGDNMRVRHTVLEVAQQQMGCDTFLTQEMNMVQARSQITQALRHCRD